MNLAPPYVCRHVTLEADDEALQEQDIRAATVRVYSEFEGEKRPEEKTISTRNGPFPAQVELIQPRGAAGFEYEIFWRLRGNRTVASGRGTVPGSFLAIDELPGSP